MRIQIQLVACEGWSKEHNFAVPAEPTETLRHVYPRIKEKCYRMYFKPEDRQYVSTFSYGSTLSHPGYII